MDTVTVYAFPLPVTLEDIQPEPLVEPGVAVTDPSVPPPEFEIAMVCAAGFVPAAVVKEREDGVAESVAGAVVDTTSVTGTDRGELDAPAETRSIAPW
jgi:hypothetical protein